MEPDDQVIADFLESGKETVQPVAQPDAKDESPDDQVADFLDDQNVSSEKTQIEKRAAKGNKAAKRLKDEQEQDGPTEEQLAEVSETSTPTVSGTFQAAGNVANGMTDWMAARPTPGGIWPLLLAIFFFLWVILPVNDSGDTRASLLWGILTGQVGWSGSLLPPGLHGGQSAGSFGGGGVSPSAQAEIAMPHYTPDFGVY